MYVQPPLGLGLGLGTAVGAGVAVRAELVATGLDVGETAPGACPATTHPASDTPRLIRMMGRGRRIMAFSRDGAIDAIAPRALGTSEAARARAVPGHAGIYGAPVPGS